MAGTHRNSLTRRLHWLSKRVDLFVLAVLVGYATHLLIGDMAVRMANVSGDDSLLVYAYYFKYPEYFRSDVALKSFAPVAMASMLNYVPAIAFKYLEIPPEWFYVVIVYLQNIMLALAVYRLASVGTHSRAVAWIAAIFTTAYRPQWWNLGLFADLDWMPYAGFLALAFLVLSASFALERRILLAVAFLILGGMVHVVLGLIAAGMFGVFWLLLLRRNRPVGNALRGVLSIGAAVPLFVLPALLVSSRAQEIPNSELLIMLLRNGHLIPWANPACSFCLPAFGSGIVGTASVAALGLLGTRLNATQHSDARLFLVAAGFVSLACVLLHFVGFATGSIFVLRLIATRATLIFIVVAVPFVIAFLWETIRTGSALRMAVAIYFILVPVPLTAAGTALALATPESKERPQGFADILVILVQALGVSLICVELFNRWIPLAHLAIASTIPEAWYNPLFSVTSPPWWLVATVVIFGLTATRGMHMPLLRHLNARSSLAANRGALIAILIVTVLTGTLLKINRDRADPWKGQEARDYRDIQEWARDNTAPTSNYIIVGTSTYGGWRSYSHRPLINWGAGSVYYFSIEAAEYNKRLFGTHARLERTTPTKPADYNYANPDPFSMFDAQHMKEFAEEMGGDYLVRRTSWPILDLPAVYRNKTFVVYDLRKWARTF